MPTAEKGRETEKKMKGFHLRLSKRTGLVAAPKQQALLPPMPEENKLSAPLPSNIPDELGVPAARTGIS